MRIQKNTNASVQTLMFVILHFQALLQMAHAQPASSDDRALLNTIDTMQIIPNRELYTPRIMEINSYVRANRNSQVLQLRELVEVVGIRNIEGTILLTLGLKGVPLTSLELSQPYIEDLTNLLLHSTVNKVPVLYFLLTEMSSIYLVPSKRTRIDLAFSRYTYINKVVNQGIVFTLSSGRLVDQQYYVGSDLVTDEIFPRPPRLDIKVSPLDLPAIRSYKVDNKHIKRSRDEYCKIAFSKLKEYYTAKFGQDNIVFVESDLYLKLYPVNGYINNKSYLERVAIEIALIQFNPEAKEIEIIIFLQGRFAETTSTSAVTEDALTKFLDLEFPDQYKSRFDEINNLIFKFIE